MRTAFFSLVLVTMVGLVAEAQPAADTNKPKETRRCAYLGFFGSFHLTGATGTAAYVLGDGQYIADLSAAGEDNNFWVYRATKGDALTTHWAFARHPDACGTYRVWRREGGFWIPFEETRAWGIGLNLFGSTETAVSTAGPTNQELLDKLNLIEDKLRRIQPGAQPSLEDLQNQINAKK